MKRRTIDSDIIREAIADLDLEPLHATPAAAEKDIVQKLPASLVTVEPAAFRAHPLEPKPRQSLLQVQSLSPSGKHCIGSAGKALEAATGSCCTRFRRSIPGSAILITTSPVKGFASREPVKFYPPRETRNEPKLRIDAGDREDPHIFFEPHCGVAVPGSGSVSG